MSAKQHTRESIIQTLKNIAAKLGRTKLSTKDVAANIPLSVINYHFGKLSKALDAAGLAGNKPGSLEGISKNRLNESELFETVFNVEKIIGHAPSLSEYRANGGTLSVKPFRTRFGNWSTALQFYHKWKVENGSICAIQNKPSSGLDVSRKQLKLAHNSPAAVPTALPLSEAHIKPRKLQLFGEPIDFRGLRHAPINEQGVVYLFGMVSRELGFSVEALQQGFPDCEGKYLHDKGRQLWAKARIEFEFRASNFREHGHNENDCDVIVCWENDWPDCPLRVVELRSEILRLPAR